MPTIIYKVYFVHEINLPFAFALGLGLGHELKKKSLVIKQSQYFIRNIKKEEKDWHEKEPPKIQTPVRWLSSIISNYHSSRLHAGFNQLTIFSWLLLTLFAFKVAKNTI